MHKSLTLAIRMNERRIVGDIQGQHQLKINTGNVQTTLEFTLYVVKRQN